MLIGIHISKKIVHKIIEKEIKETGIKVNVSPITNLEAFINIISNRITENNQNGIDFLLILKKIIVDVKDYKNLGLFLEENDEIKIFLTNIKKDNYKKDYLYDLLFTTYHEYKHAIIYKEDRKQRDDLTNFYLLIHAIAFNIAEEFYDTNHDDFYEEIIADKYAIEKTEKFLKSHPALYKESELYAECKKLKNKIYYQNYDVQLFINYIGKSIKNNRTELVNKIDEISFSGMILEKNGTFKNLKDILTAESLSKEIKTSLVSSKAYLKEIDYNNLTIEELNFILNSLKHTYAEELLRYEQNQKLKIEINNFNIKVAHSKENFEYNRDLFPLINRKQKRTKFKIQYLKLQMEKVELLLNKKLSNKKLAKIIK